MTRLNRQDHWARISDGTRFHFQFCAAVIAMLITLQSLSPIVDRVGVPHAAQDVILFSFGIVGIFIVSGYMIYRDVVAIQRTEDV